LWEFSLRCTVQRVLTFPSRLDAMNRLGRALADPTRCRILLALLDGPRYPAQLAAELGLSRSNTSNHLGCLRGCGVIVALPEGRQIRYELVDDRLRHALGDLLGVVLAVDAAQPCVDATATP
jgi:DNA-binding transcriptional ArsR family regulator